MMPVVSRETLTECDTPRRYQSGYRTAKSELTARTIRDAALALVAEGNFRPSLHQVAARAEVGGASINDHFGYIHLLWRVLAREHTDEVARAAGLPIWLPVRDRADLVWLIMTGERRT